MERGATNELSLTLTAVEHLEGNPTVFCCYDRSWGLIASLLCQNKNQFEFASEFGSVEIHAKSGCHVEA